MNRPNKNDLDYTLVMIDVVLAFKELLPNTKIDKKYLQLVKDNPKKKNKNKKFYKTYGTKIVKMLNKYINNMQSIVYVSDTEFELIYNNKGSVNVCLEYPKRLTNIIYPSRLMKLCGYQKNTTVYDTYTKLCQKYNTKVYDKIKKYKKYSNMSERAKTNDIVIPMTKIIHDTLSQKRKTIHIEKLQKTLFTPSQKIMFRLFRNKLSMYDFGYDINSPTNKKMKILKNGDMLIKFSSTHNDDHPEKSNTMEFLMMARTNGQEIKNQITIRYLVKFSNMPEHYLIASKKITN
jgi:hypothetical protein